MLIASHVLISLFMQVRKVLSAAKDGVEEGHAPSE